MGRVDRIALIAAGVALGWSAASFADPPAALSVEACGDDVSEAALEEVVRLELDDEPSGPPASYSLAIDLSCDGRSARIGIGMPGGAPVDVALDDLPPGVIGRRVVALAAAELVHREVSRPSPREAVEAPAPALEPVAEEPRAPRPPRASPERSEQHLLTVSATLRSFLLAAREGGPRGVTLFGLRAARTLLGGGSTLCLSADAGVEATQRTHRLGDTWIVAAEVGLAPRLEASVGTGTLGLGLRTELGLVWAQGSSTNWNVRERQGTALLVLSSAEMGFRHRVGHAVALEASVAGGIALAGTTLVIDGSPSFGARGGFVMLTVGVAWLGVTPRGEER